MIQRIGKPVVVGLGEILWDIFPSGRRLGGAPLNFAFHCQQLGALAIPVSRIGQDSLGSELYDKVGKLGISRAGLQYDSIHPTGSVNIQMDSKGQPDYEIQKEVAWDYLFLTPQIEVILEKADAVYFGTLAQRYHITRTTIQKMIESLRPEALRICDLNLRQNYFSKPIIEWSLQQADIVKLNEPELAELSMIFSLSGSTENKLNELLNKFKISLIAYTRGSKGSLIMTKYSDFDHYGFPTDIVDTVGAGDAFTATLCMGLLNGDSVENIIEDANKIASFVCSQPGALPVFPEKILPGRLARI